MKYKILSLLLTHRADSLSYCKKRSNLNYRNVIIVKIECFKLHLVCKHYIITLYVADFKLTERPLLVNVHFRRMKNDFGELSSVVLDVRISFISS